MTQTRRASAGFTLIEVLAAVLLTSIVIGVAVALYINLANSTTIAAARTRETRNAVAILDRIARDLEASYMLEKAPEVDPLEHPWVFVAEGKYSGEGADRLKFVTRNYRPSQSDGHASDVAVVSYALIEEEEGEPDRYSILRWSAPSLPDGLDRTFPAEESETAMVLAEGIRFFDVRLMGQGGAWTDAWDSSQLQQSGDLPRMAEIRIALVPNEFDTQERDEEEPELYVRRVRLPLRPIPLPQLIEQQIALVGGGEDIVDVNEDGIPDDEEELPPATNCQNYFIECFNANVSAFREQLSPEEFQWCREKVLVVPWCMEEKRASKICGVRVKCYG